MDIQRLKAAPVAMLLALGLLVAGSSSFAAEEQATAAEHKFELAKQYYGQCADTDSAQFDSIRPQLKAFTDMEVMAETMADPSKFMQLMSVVSDPRTIHVMSKCATEPVMWDAWMSGMTDFNKMSRTMTHFMNPNMVMSWMMAPMNPAMYQPMMQMAEPAYYTHWMNAMANPAFYQPITSLADPAWYTPRVNWMMNPQSMQPMFSMMNMGNYFVPVAPVNVSVDGSGNQ
ncbi:MAG: hypothetical protein GY935_05105 [Gammaproteobacteria bacterium]|nr:hypothetical protein [Gammaproteobacteria bacterium]